MQILLFDNEKRSGLFPLTLNRSVSDCRIGILTIREWWEILSGFPVYVHTEKYLKPLYEDCPNGDTILINSAVLPNEALLNKLLKLEPGNAIEDNNGMIGGRVEIKGVSPDLDFVYKLFYNFDKVQEARRLIRPFEVFNWNDECIRSQFSLLTTGLKSQPISSTNQVISPENIFIEEGAVVEYSTINASCGPVYIGKNALVMEGCLIRGPFAMCEGAALKMGSKIYGATTLGPYCVGGGEIKNSVMFGFTNKGHDGYLGDSVIGEWCNLGAGTSNSNLKNNGSLVQTWNYYSNEFEPSGNKCGLIMGDYSKTAINTSLNTGTVIGICCNVYGQGLTEKFIPNFSWGGNQGVRYDINKAIADIETWKKMKKQSFNEVEKGILRHIFDPENENA